MLPQKVEYGALQVGNDDCHLEHDELHDIAVLTQVREGCAEHHNEAVHGQQRAHAGHSNDIEVARVYSLEK